MQVRCISSPPSSSVCLVPWRGAFARPAHMCTDQTPACLPRMVSLPAHLEAHIVLHQLPKHILSLMPQAAAQS